MGGTEHLKPHEPSARDFPRRVRQALGWCVHFYTALGLVCAAGIAVSIVDGTPAAFRTAFGLMFLATLIDATDGTFARAVRIKEVLPGFDGRRLDDLVDFLTYTFLPLLLLWRTDILPPQLQPTLLVPLLASAYGFCQTSVKTDDGYFLGFPSYWNLVAFYLYFLHEYVAPLPTIFTLGMLVGLALLTFVPTRYLYPSQRGRLNLFTNVLGGVWALVLGVVLWRVPPDGPADDVTQGLLLASLAFPAYYMVVSWGISGRMWMHRRRPRGRRS